MMIFGTPKPRLVPKFTHDELELLFVIADLSRRVAPPAEQQLNIFPTI